MLEADQDRQRWFAGLAALVCLGIAGFAVIQIFAELTRSPTPAEWSKARALELAGRWRSMPVGAIFPDRLGYSPDLGGEENAQLVGIASGADCGSAVDTELRNLLRPYGCRGALRAAYLDQTQGLMIDVGVLAFADPDTAARALKASGKGRLTAVTFPGSVAARFTDKALQTTVFGQRGPYLTVTSTGYSDGRPVKGQKQADLSVIAPQLAEQVLDRLNAPSKAVCGVPEYKC
jgi:hypothetical protein